MISDLAARKLASEWHGGQWSPLYALSSSGAIVAGCAEEIEECRDWNHDHEGIPWTEFRENSINLAQLAEYVAARGPRGPVEGWGNLIW